MSFLHFTTQSPPRAARLNLALCEKKEKNNMKPDAEIDGAEVLYWAWSGCEPFGVMPVSDGSEIEIYGFAIATYDHTQYYRFSCNGRWTTENDSIHLDIESAKSSIPLNYQNISVKWHKYA